MMGVKEVKRINLTPPQILVVGFAMLIFVGTLLLTLPISSANGESLSLLDAFFTATSAVCVTGLIVVDTGTYFSAFGQVVILLLIQVGGLGFMAISTLFALAIGKKITLRERLIMQEALNQICMEGIVRLTKYLLVFTFLVEGVAALILGIRWIPDLGIKKAFYYGVFHAISAFCNAGFDLFSVSLVNYRGDFIVNMVITFLFILGGIGVTVLIDLYNRYTKRKTRLSLHSKMVLTITGFLIIFGTVCIFILEFTNSSTIASLSVQEKIFTSYFQGVVTRTAGFNTLPIGELRRATLFFMIIMMFIGASPGSTGGGIKTTTFGAVVSVVYSMVKGKNDVEIFKRRIPQEIIFKALTVVLVGIGVIVSATMILLTTEDFAFIKVLFEVVSAFATVGLSTGITSHLSWIGKIVIVVVMFLGRVGPLTLAFALAERQRKKTRINYPEEKIIVG